MKRAGERDDYWLKTMTKRVSSRLPFDLRGWIDPEDITQELLIARLNGESSPGSVVQHKMRRLARKQAHQNIEGEDTLRPTENAALGNTFGSEVQRAVAMSAPRSTSVERLLDIFISHGGLNEPLSDIGERHGVSRNLVDKLYRTTLSRIRKSQAHLLRPFLER